MQNVKLILKISVAEVIETTKSDNVRKLANITNPGDWIFLMRKEGSGSSEPTYLMKIGMQETTARVRFEFKTALINKRLKVFATQWYEHEEWRILSSVAYSLMARLKKNLIPKDSKQGELKF